MSFPHPSAEPDDAEGQDFEFWEDTDWDPEGARERRRARLRIVALVVVVAMILTLVVPVIVRITRPPAPSEPQGVLTWVDTTLGDAAKIQVPAAALPVRLAS